MRIINQALPAFTTSMFAFWSGEPGNEATCNTKSTPKIWAIGSLGLSLPSPCTFPLPFFRIARMVRQPRGNALLVGVGGTGKQSLTRMAAHMCGYNCFQIELMRGYNYESFHEDLKKIYHMAGVKGEDTVFLFTDTQVQPAQN